MESHLQNKVIMILTFKNVNQETYGRYVKKALGGIWLGRYWKYPLPSSHPKFICSDYPLGILDIHD
jgi:hypothetical protein